jgi:hypothetical protein
MLASGEQRTVAAEDIVKFLRGEIGQLKKDSEQKA